MMIMAAYTDLLSALKGENCSSFYRGHWCNFSANSNEFTNHSCQVSSLNIACPMAAL